MVRGIGARRIATFRRKVYRCSEEHGRGGLPWRLGRDPYRILVSEFMLQQTQVPRVLGSFEAFIARFPDFGTLARATLREVLAAWSGLGYNRRAKNLRETARIVVDRHGGSLPRDPDLLAALPGVGPATAGAVSAFAFGIAVPFIETNIRAVFIHFFFPRGGPVRDAEILPLVELTLDREDPRAWYYALMDCGAALKARGAVPSTRSAHYARQGLFRGSDRQARGLVVRALTAGPLGRRALLEATGLDPARLDRNAARLAGEGMIVIRRGKYSIA